MQFKYVLQYRDVFEAQAIRFPGDPAPARRVLPLRARVAGWLLLLACAIVLYLLLSRTAACPALLAALHRDGRWFDHPVFAAGAVLSAAGGAMVIAPVAYVFARRRSTRSVGPHAEVTVTLDEVGVTLTTAHKALRVTWDGIAAFAETPTLFVLKTAGDLRLILPLRAAGNRRAEQWLREEFSRLVVPLATAVQPMGVAA